MLNIRSGREERQELEAEGGDSVASQGDVNICFQVLT